MLWQWEKGDFGLQRKDLQQSISNIIMKKPERIFEIYITLFIPPVGAIQCLGGRTCMPSGGLNKGDWQLLELL